MIYLVSYDIESDRLRKKIADRLLAEGLERIQYSVFIGPVKSTRIGLLEQWLQGKIDLLTFPSNRLLMLPLSQESLKKITILSKESVNLDLLFGHQRTLFV